MASEKSYQRTIEAAALPRKEKLSRILTMIRRKAEAAIPPHRRP